jgi:outer membrane lipase/esterase
MFFHQAFSRMQGASVLSALPITLITGLPTSAFSASLSAQNFDQIYVFGDSLSDDGNLFKADGGVYPASPPYFNGRFSNSPI